jgi:hypothetical protein
MSEGIASELIGMDLGDKRLNERSVRVLESLAADPEASVNAASRGWAETNGAYRLFQNPSVTPEKILAPHIEATKRRIAQHPTVLIVQDTTELDFTQHPPRDAKCLNTETRKGLYDHTHLAVTPDRLCLGVVGQTQFARDAESLGKTDERVNLPIEEKESFRWLAGYRLASDIKGEHPDARIVNVADREADIYDIFVETRKHPTPADFVIRAKEPRCTPDLAADGGEAEYEKMLDVVKASPIRGRRIVELPKTPKREARKAELEIRATRVTLKPPHARGRLPQVTLNVVWVEEANAPDDGTGVSWLLLTTLPIETLDQTLLVLDYYMARWIIEVYFRTLKTGCRVEEIRLETVDRVKNCLAFYKIVAWRVMQLTYLHRECPKLSVTAVFDDAEWKSVWRITTKKELPASPPTLAEFVPLLATLGGYNCRANDPPPGPQALWTGIRRMTDFALAWLAFGPEKK